MPASCRRDDWTDCCGFHAWSSRNAGDLRGQLASLLSRAFLRFCSSIDCLGLVIWLPLDYSTRPFLISTGSMFETHLYHLLSHQAEPGKHTSHLLKHANNTHLLAKVQKAFIFGRLLQARVDNHSRNLGIKWTWLVPLLQDKGTCRLAHCTRNLLGDFDPQSYGFFQAIILGPKGQVHDHDANHQNDLARIRLFQTGACLRIQAVMDEQCF